MRSCYITQGAQSGALWWPREVGRGDGREAQEEGETCVVMADLHCCTAETNTTLVNLKKKKKEIHLQVVHQKISRKKLEVSPF